MKIAISLLLLSSLTSCATDKLKYIECKPYSFQQATLPPRQVIRVKTEDAELYKAYIDSLRNKLKFLNEQITDYENGFK